MVGRYCTRVCGTYNISLSLCMKTPAHNIRVASNTLTGTHAHAHAHITRANTHTHTHTCINKYIERNYIIYYISYITYVGDNFGCVVCVKACGWKRGKRIRNPVIRSLIKTIRLNIHMPSFRPIDSVKYGVFNCISIIFKITCLNAF